MRDGDRRGQLALLAGAVLAVPLGVAADSIAVSAVGAVLAGILVTGLAPRTGALIGLSVACIWSNAAVVASKLHGAPGVIALVPIAVLAAIVTARAVFGRHGLVVTAAFRMLLVHGAVLALAALVAVNSVLALGPLETFGVEGLLLWFLVVNAITDIDRLRIAVVSIVAVAALLGLLSTLQFVTSSYESDFLGFAQVDASELGSAPSDPADVERLAGSIGEKNRYAQILLVMVPLAVALSWRRVRHSWWPTTAIAPIVAGVALSGSRGAAVGLAVTLVAMVFLRLVTLRALLVVGFVFALFVIAVPSYRDRLVSTVRVTQGLESNEEIDGSTLGRVAENIAAYHVLVDHPVLGVGPGGFPEHYEDYAERVGLNVREGEREAHNLYLGLAAESGVLGLATFLGVIGLVVVRLLDGWSRSRRSDPEMAALTAGFFCAVVAYLVSGVFLHLAFERYLWLLLALADVTGRLAAQPIEGVEVGEHELVVAGGPSHASSHR